MNDKKWDQFFSLLGDLVDDVDAGPWRERAADVVRRSSEHEAEGTLDEFLNWFGGSSDLEGLQQEG